LSEAERTSKKQLVLVENDNLQNLGSLDIDAQECLAADWIAHRLQRVIERALDAVAGSESAALVVV